MRKIYVLLILGVFCYSCKKDDTKLEAIACFDYYPNAELKVGDTITFSNCSENSSRYYWDFGNNLISTESSPVHVYKNYGTYRIKLIAFNNNSSDTIVKVIKIKDNTKACFDYYPKYNIKVGDTIRFTNCSEFTTNYHWDFGDSHTSYESSPIHVFTDSGSFLIKLTALNQNSKDTSSMLIKVRALTDSELLCYNIWSLYSIQFESDVTIIPDSLYFYFNFRSNGNLLLEWNFNNMVEKGIGRWSMSNSIINIDFDNSKESYKIKELKFFQSLKLEVEGNLLLFRPKNK